MQAPAPPRLVEAGLPTEATVAQVLVAKYADQLPLYRQAQIYARQGTDLDRSTLADWVGNAAFLLRPVHERLFERLKASAKLFADETTAPVLDSGRGRTKTGQLFNYARDERHWGGADPPVLPTSMRPIGRPSILSGICRALSACCRSTAMPATRRWSRLHAKQAGKLHRHDLVARREFGRQSNLRRSACRRPSRAGQRRFWGQDQDHWSEPSICSPAMTRLPRPAARPKAMAEREREIGHPIKLRGHVPGRGVAARRSRRFPAAPGVSSTWRGRSCSRMGWGASRPRSEKSGRCHYPADAIVDIARS